AGSSNGSRAERNRRRASGTIAIASASRSGPRARGVEASRPRASAGFGPDATWIEPSEARAATAHEVGPWIRSPLRMAMPPSRRRSGSSGAGSVALAAGAALTPGLASLQHPLAEVGVEARRQAEVGDRRPLVGAVDEGRRAEE